MNTQNNSPQAVLCRLRQTEYRARTSSYLPQSQSASVAGFSTDPRAELGLSSRMLFCRQFHDTFDFARHTRGIYRRHREWQRLYPIPLI
jgi:hypothetical protein